jgi:hypothetical protein
MFHLARATGVEVFSPSVRKSFIYNVLQAIHQLGVVIRSREY